MRKNIIGILVSTVVSASLFLTVMADGIEIQIDMGDATIASESTEIGIIYPVQNNPPPVTAPSAPTAPASPPATQQPSESVAANDKQEEELQDTDDEELETLDEDLLEPTTSLIGKSAGTLVLTENNLIFAPLIQLQQLDMNIDTVYSQSILAQLNAN